MGKAWMAEHNITHGGSRPGAGRPTLPPAERKQTKSITLPGALWAKIEKRRGKLSRSAFLGKLLER